MFAPTRELSDMLVHNGDPTPEFMEKLGMQTDLSLLQMPADGAVALEPDAVAEMVEAFKAERMRKMYDGAAGVRLVREGLSDEAEEAPPPAEAPAGEVTRWKPRMTAGQLTSAREAAQHFAAAYAESNDQPTIGASSTKLAIQPTYFNILYTHPSFGHMQTWAASGVGSKTLPLLPPVNSRAAANVTAKQRCAARVNCGWRYAFPPRNLPPVALPASPSKHCVPSPPLPPAPRLRAKTCAVPDSTNPWKRLPPHTAHQKAKYEAMYGPNPADSKLRKKHEDAVKREERQQELKKMRARF